MRRRRTPGLLAGVLGSWVLTFACMAAVATAATCPGSAGKRCAYDRIATYGDRAPGELHTPRGVAVGPNGHIYVADTNARDGGGRLVVYDGTGAYAGELSPPHYFQPDDVGVSADGAVYALDGGGVSVHRFDAAGGYTRLNMPYGFSGPTFSIRADHFAVQSDGTFWMLYRHGLVEHRGATGALLGSFTVEGWHRPGITAAADGHVFIGSANGGVNEHAPSGAVLGKLNVSASERMSIAPDGDLVTGISSTVSRINRDGTGLSTFGAQGADPGQFRQIDGVAVAPAGALAAGRAGEETFVVVDRENHRVQIVAPDGAPLAILGAPQDSSLLGPTAAWGTPDGGFVVADTRNRRLVRFTATGASAGRADGGLDDGPDGGAYDPAGGGSVVMGGAFQIRRFGADGALLGEWPMPGVSGSGFGGGIAVAEDGTIWAAHSPAPHGGHVAAYAPDGTLQRQIVDAHIDRPIAIATGPGGEVHVVEGGGANFSVVDVFGPDGAFRRRLDALSCLSTQSIAVDGAGRIYAGLGDRVAVLDRSGALLARFGEHGSAVGQFNGTQLSILGDVLTITENDNHRVTRVHIDAAALGAPEPPPCGPVMLAEPRGSVVMFAATTLAVKGARVRVPLGCNGTPAASCDGAVALLRRSVRPGQPIGKKDTLAIASYRVGRVGSVALKLKKAERRMLKRNGRLKARIVVQPRRGAAISRTVTLKVPKPAAKRKKSSKKRR